MKRIGAVFTWLSFAIGIPLTLTAVDCTPRASLIRSRSNFAYGNWEIFFLYLASILLWLIWLYGLSAFVHDLWRLKFLRSRPGPEFGFRKWIAVSAAALWSLLLASQASAATVRGTSEGITLYESESASTSADFHSLDVSSSTPLALSTSTVLVTGMLQFIQSRRRAILRDSVPHSRSHIISQRSQSTLKELQLAESVTKCRDIRKAMSSILENDCPPVLASWRPGSIPRAVLHRSKQRRETPPSCCIPLGLSQGEVILVTLSPGEVVSIGSENDDRARSVLAHLAQSVILETMGSNTHIFTLGFSNTELIGARNLTTVNTEEQLNELVMQNDSFHPIFVCSADRLSVKTMNQFREIGCCVITTSIDVEPDVSLIHTERGWTVDQTQLEVSLFGISLEERTAVSRLVDEVSRPITVPVLADPLSAPTEWKVIVRMLGPVEVITRDGKTIRFEKSKSIELLAWLTTHRSRPSRSAARTALWEVNVQDATFTNVVSDVRRSLGRVSPLAENEEWLTRTLTDVLPLHRSITTDGELLDTSIRRAISLDEDSALAELRTSLEYVRDLPFSGSNFLWSDSEGITTQLTLSVMTSAVMASQLYLERGDTEGVFWATGCGLKVLPGHEELLALRMRAHALKGDLAAVRAEWNSHQRSIARDAWSGGATSPKLNELCRSLLRSPRQEVYSVSE